MNSANMEMFNHHSRLFIWRIQYWLLYGSMGVEIEFIILRLQKQVGLVTVEGSGTKFWNTVSALVDFTCNNSYVLQNRLSINISKDHY